MMVAICHKMDLGDAWEWSDDPRCPGKWAALAYRIAMNLRPDALEVAAGEDVQALMAPRSLCSGCFCEIVSCRKKNDRLLRPQLYMLIAGLELMYRTRVLGTGSGSASTGWNVTTAGGPTRSAPVICCVLETRLFFAKTVNISLRHLLLCIGFPHNSAAKALNSAPSAELARTVRPSLLAAKVSE